MNRKQRRAAGKPGQTSRDPSAKSQAPAAAGTDAADWIGQGLQYQQAGRLVEAEACYRRVLAAEPDHADALHFLGVVAHQSGHHDRAVELIGQAIRRNAQNPIYFSNLGIALKHQRKAGEAPAYREAIRIKPDYPDAFYNCGNLLLELRRLDEALASYDTALALRPDHAAALHNRGLVLLELKRPGEALASLEKAVTLKPDYPEAFRNRGRALQRLERPAEALASYDRALALKPNYREALNGRTVALLKLGRLAEALASCDQTLRLAPDYAEAFNDRGVILQEMKRFDEALASYRKAQELKPGFAEPIYNAGVVLQLLNRLDEALAHFDRACALQPNFADAHCHGALLRLLTGDFERGWVESEWRWRSASSGLARPGFTQPLWLGGEAIDGKTILLQSEQGYGDSIQFCRYVPLVAARGARVILQVEEPLRQLMSGLAGVSLCISKDEALPAFDLHCPLLSLPLAFGTRLETIPSATSYLSVPAQARDWQAQLAPSPGPRIGLAWSGNSQHPRDAERSIAFAKLSPLFDLPASFIGLQRDVRPHDQAALQARGGVLNLGPSMANFADAAALVSQLDLVIAVDTGIAHLAAALGRPVWMLLPLVPDWRWLLDREDTPWYPTMRLFRQPERGDWDSVIISVGVELRAMLEAPRLS
jgi:tetratricopeptide (TPR) repeat protein